MQSILKREIGTNSALRTRQRIMDCRFASRHREREQDFTRDATLTFPCLMLFLLRKSVKSLQNRWHEYWWALQEEARGSMVGSSAITHARKKLKGSAFEELNRECVLDLFYSPKYEPIVKRWRGHRLLGVDGSTIRLPQSQALREAFGEVESKNQHGKIETYPEGRLSVLYDLLNGLGLEGRLVSSKVGEVTLAIDHLAQSRPGDVIVADRGYCGFEWFAQVVQQKVDFICRCQERSFGRVNQLLAENEAGVSVVEELPAHSQLADQLREKGLPVGLSIRWVSVRLPNGELEVLATSLLDEQQYPTAELAEVYGKRWGHETYYGTLKGALDLEHFTGKTPVSVEQDLQSMVYLANLQTLLMLPAEEELTERSRHLKNPLKVNRSVALNAVKNQAMDLLASDKPIREVTDQLTRWFMATPVASRPQRKVPRRKPSPRRSYNYQKRSRKFVF